MTKLLFATETVKTSQGWFETATLLPQLDLPLEEIDQLISEKKAGECDHDSPLAAHVHSLATWPNKAAASVHLKATMSAFSASSPGDESIELDADFVDPTPPGEFPTLENYQKAGYKAENYEAHKAGFYEDKRRKEDEALQKAVAEKKAAEQEAAEKAEAIAKMAEQAAAQKAETEKVEQAAAQTNEQKIEGENPGSQAATEPTTT